MDIIIQMRPLVPLPPWELVRCRADAHLTSIAISTHPKTKYLAINYRYRANELRADKCQVYQGSALRNEGTFAV